MPKQVRDAVIVCVFFYCRLQFLGYSVGYLDTVLCMC
eukprot:COSAG02_NODE_37787_length_437_cov_1.153846_2_plen_36_part_01